MSDFSVINEDRTLAKQSILRVAEYPFEEAVFGHGGPLDKRANQALRNTSCMQTFLDRIWPSSVRVMRTYIPASVATQ